MLAVIDDCTRECLCLVAHTSLSGARVARKLSALTRIYGKLGSIVCNSGTKFTSRAILKWVDENTMSWHYIDPFGGKSSAPRCFLIRLTHSRIRSSKALTAACGTSCSTRKFSAT